MTDTDAEATLGATVENLVDRDELRAEVRQKYVEVAENPAFTVEIEFNMDGMAIKKLHAFGVFGNRLMHFCGTAGLGDYDDYKDKFIAALQSIEPHSMGE